MKGLVIVAVLIAVIGGTLIALLRPSDADLRRIETGIVRLLDETDAALTEATRIMNRLRVIRPTAIPLDNELNTLRADSARQRELVLRLAEESPEAKDSRATFLDRRREARDAATRLRDAATDLVARATVVEDIMKEVQPRVRVMLASFGDLYALRNAFRQEGREITPALSTKIEYLRVQVQRKKSIAKSALEAGMQDAKQGAGLRTTAAREIELIIADIQAVGEQLISTTETGKPGG